MAESSIFEWASSEPKLLISSETAGWEGISVSAYHEPAQLEGWIVPGTLDASVVLVARGSLRMAHRLMPGSWKEHCLYQGQLSLQPGEKSPAELRWTALSSEPLYLLNLNLSYDMLVRTSQELTGKEPELIGRSGFQDPLLTQIGFALWRELEQDAPGGKLYAQTAAQMLAVHLLHHYAPLPAALQETSQGLSHHQLKIIIDFILAHLGENLSLDVLAQQIGFSPYHFARLFREGTGESPHQFVLRQRIELAKQLLRKADMSLATIALECGFANQSHLTRVFKRYLKLTPRMYQQDTLLSRTFLP